MPERKNNCMMTPSTWSSFDIRKLWFRISARMPTILTEAPRMLRQYFELRHDHSHLLFQLTNHNCVTMSRISLTNIVAASYAVHQNWTGKSAISTYTTHFNTKITSHFAPEVSFRMIPTIKTDHIPHHLAFVNETQCVFCEILLAEVQRSEVKRNFARLMYWYSCEAQVFLRQCTRKNDSHPNYVLIFRNAIRNTSETSLHKQ